jgi:hypothetical protein
MYRKGGVIRRGCKGTLGDLSHAKARMKAKNASIYSLLGIEWAHSPKRAVNGVLSRPLVKNWEHKRIRNG